MRQFGLEIEFWVINGLGEAVLVPSGVGMDACGYIGEARGQPFVDIVDAVYSAKADLSRQIAKVLKNDKLGTTDNPVMKVSPTVRLAAARTNNKGLVRYQNLYGHENHKVKYNSGERTAGVHLSVTESQSFGYTSVDSNNVRTQRVHNYNGMWDFPRFFRYLDGHFKEEIKAAKRLPGFYEIKADGRVEYRSLPSNVELSKLIQVVQAYDFNG